MTIADVQRYEYGGLAKAVQSPGIKIGALEKLATDLGVTPDGDGFVQGTLASEAGINRATGVYDGKYQDAKNTTNVGDLYGHYAGTIFGGLTPAEIAKFEAEFNPFAGESFGDIKQEIAKSEALLEAQKNGYIITPVEEADAKDVLRRYGKMMQLTETFEQIRFEALRPAAADEFRVKSLKELAENL